MEDKIWEKLTRSEKKRLKRKRKKCEKTLKTYLDYSYLCLTLAELVITTMVNVLEDFFAQNIQIFEQKIWY